MTDTTTPSSSTATNLQAALSALPAEDLKPVLVSFLTNAATAGTAQGVALQVPVLIASVIAAGPKLESDAIKTLANAGLHSLGAPQV